MFRLDLNSSDQVSMNASRRSPVRFPRGGLALALILSTVATTTTPAPAQEIWGQIQLVIPEQTLPNAVVGVPYHEIIEMSAGAAPVEWEHWSLAPGMELAADLDERHAVLSGTPDIPGVYPFQLLAFDSRGDVASVELVLRVVELPPEILLDPSGDLDGDGKSNLEEHSMGTSFTEWNGPSSPRITVAPDTGGRPIMHVPLAPGTTEVYRVAQAWDETTGTWTNIPLDPNPNDSFLTVGMPYSSNLASPVMGRVLFSIGAPTPQQKLLDLIKKLEEARDAIDNADRELKENPLLQQTDLIKRIWSILDTPDEIKKLMDEWLGENIPEYNEESFKDDIEKIRRALCYAKKLLEFLKDNINEGESQLEVERRELAVNTAIAAIDVFKTALDQGGDLHELHELFKQARDNLREVLKDKAEEYVSAAIQAMIWKIIERRVGKNKAEEILKAAKAPLDFIQALVKNGELKTANRLHYELYVEMLEVAYQIGTYRIADPRTAGGDTPWNENRHLFLPCEALEKRVEVRAKLVYWDPEGGEQGGGNWIEMPVRLWDRNQENSTEVIVRESFETDTKGKCHLKFGIVWDDFKRKAADKRHVHLRIDYKIGDGDRKALFGGVYQP